MPKLIAATICMGGNLKNIDFLRPILEELGYDLITISDIPEATHKWSVETQFQDLMKADVVLCVTNPAQPCKSSLRAVNAMALGKPVIASNIQAYREAIQHGINGFLCDNLEEYKTALELCQEKDYRKVIGENALKATQGCYDIETIGNQWKKNLETRLDNNKPKVNIIIPSWNNLQYLKETIKSIRATTFWPHSIIVVNSGTQSLQWLTNQPDITVLHNPERIHFSEAVNQGINYTKDPYIAILNDDLILTENWLSALMFEAQKKGVGGVNGFSNCEVGWLHNEIINVDGIDLIPSMKLEQVSHIIPKIMQLRHKKKVTKRPWLAFYCTVIPRAVINKVGLLEEEFKSGGEDHDLSRRIVKAGYRLLTTDDAVVFHCGGVSRSKSEKLNYDQHHKEDAENNRLMKEKEALRNKQDAFTASVFLKSDIQFGDTNKNYRGGSKKTIAIYTGPAFDEWDLKTPDVKGIGGSETCAILLAKEFVNRGFFVHLYGQHQNKDQQDIRLYHYSEFDPNVNYDLLIVSRNLDIITQKIKTKKVIAWCHDVYFQSFLGQNKTLSQEQLNKIDHYIALTPEHRELLLNYHSNIPKGKLIVIKNPFNLSRYSPVISKIPNRMIYASSPDRGLDVLLHVYPYIKEAIPDLSLTIAYGFDNWIKSCQQSRDQNQIDYMNNMLKKIKELKSQGVNHIGRINQIQLAEEFQKSVLLAYPCHFFETSCLTVLEAFASGTQVLTTKLGGLITTVGDAGVLLDGDSCSTEYCKSFVENTVKLLKNPNQELIIKGLDKVKQHSPNVAIQEWLKLII